MFWDYDEALSIFLVKIVSQEVTFALFLLPLGRFRLRILHHYIIQGRAGHAQGGGKLLPAPPNASLRFRIQRIRDMTFDVGESHIR